MKLSLWKAVVGLAVLVVVQSSQTPVGTWKLQVEWPNGTVEATVMVTYFSGELKAVWGGPQGEVELREVTFVDNLLTFYFDVQSGSGEGVGLPFEGRIEGNQMDGVLHMPNGTDVQADGERQR
jgi:hypothetical protein